MNGGRRWMGKNNNFHSCIMPPWLYCLVVQNKMYSETTWAGDVSLSLINYICLLQTNLAVWEVDDPFYTASELPALTAHMLLTVLDGIVP